MDKCYGFAEMEDKIVPLIPFLKRGIINSKIGNSEKEIN
jgi:hypothetical protein